MLVHFTIVSQFYVHVNVEFLYTRFLTFMLISTMAFMWWKRNKAKLKELSNNISDRSEA